MNISNHTFCEDSLSNCLNMHSNALFEIFYFEIDGDNNYNNTRLTISRIGKNNISLTKKIIMILNLYLYWNESRFSSSYWSQELQLLK